MAKSTKKSNNANGSGHIKRRTAGTSNEISFSVLDSIKGDDEELDDHPLGKISLFTLGEGSSSSARSGKSKKGRSLKRFNGSANAKHASRASHAHTSSNLNLQTAWGGSPAEIGIRKQRRIQTRRIIVFLIIAACAVAVFIGANMAIGMFRQHQDVVNDLNSQIESVGNLYEQTADFRAVVEYAITTPLPDIDPDDLQKRYDASISGFEGTLTKLRAAKTSLENLQENLSLPNDTQAMNDALQSVNAQLNTVEIGRELVNESIQAAKEYRTGAGIIDKILAADSKARDAVTIKSVFDDTQAENAKTLSGQARDEFAVVRDEVQSLIEQTTPLFEEEAKLNNEDMTSFQNPLQVYVDYINLRIDAQNAAIRADDAYLRRNSEELSEANESYNDLETRAADLYLTIQATPESFIQVAYEKVKSDDENISLWNAEVAKISAQK